MKLIRLAIFKTALVICLLFAGQAEAEYSKLIVSDTMFTPDATIDTEGVEKGVLNGVIYSFDYSSGTGSFAGLPESNLGMIRDWLVHCDKDAITDKKSCWMVKGDLWVTIHENGQVIVGIGSDHYPFTPVTIRIDGGKPITSPVLKETKSFSPTVSKKIVERLKTAKHVATRCVTWPYKSWDDEEWDVYGFNEALEFLNWAIKHIK